MYRLGKQKGVAEVGGEVFGFLLLHWVMGSVQ
jgi:hypothetical protein